MADQPLSAHFERADRLYDKLRDEAEANTLYVARVNDTGRVGSVIEVDRERFRTLCVAALDGEAS